MKAYIPKDIMRHFRAWTGKESPIQDLESEMNSWLGVQKKRLDYIRNVCYHVRQAAEVSRPKADELLKHIVVDSHDQVMFCPVLEEKHDSSWRRELARYASQSLRLEHFAKGDVDWEEAVDKEAILRRQHDHILNKEAPAEEVKDAEQIRRELQRAKTVEDIVNSPHIKGFARILLTEHPFERLLSFFLETIHGKEGKLGRRITEGIQDMEYRKLSENRRRQKDVTFALFMKYTLFHYASDPHLQAAYHICHPCDIQYDYVIRIETFHRDVNNIFLKLHEKHGGDPNDEIMKTPYMPASRYFSYFNLTDENWISRMLYQKYSKLDTDLLLRTHDVFSIDNLLFNYSWPFQNVSLT